MGQKQTGPALPEEPGSQVDAPAKTRQLFSPTALDSLRGAENTSELGNRFLQMALKDYEDSLAPGDLQRTGNMLRDYLEQDPFLQGKLERVSSLLGKAK